MNLGILSGKSSANLSGIRYGKIYGYILALLLAFHLASTLADTVAFYLAYIDILSGIVLDILSGIPFCTLSVEVRRRPARAVFRAGGAGGAEHL